MGQETVDNWGLRTRRIEQFAEGGSVEFLATQKVSHFYLMIFFFLERGYGIEADRACTYIYLLRRDDSQKASLGGFFWGIYICEDFPSGLV